MVAEEDSIPEEILERWVLIQKATFTNWVNDKLSVKNINMEDITTDFKTGVYLCHLIEALQDRDIGKIIDKKVMNHYQSAGNLSLAMNAMNFDNVRFVNIGPEDIAGGNLKLILGMLWTLIRHYQIGHVSKLPPKKSMLLLINALLHPRKTVTNFNTDWNSGMALMGIIEWCQTGSFKNWYSRNRHLERANCEEALEKAHESFGIPMVLDAENFASHEVDDLSVMTYLSYYFSIGSPVHTKLLEWLQEAIKPIKVTNFGTDWRDGQVALALAYVTGALNDANPPKFDSKSSLENCSRAINASKLLGVPEILRERDMSVVGGNYNISLMAYVAWHYVLCGTLKQTLPRSESEDEEEFESYTESISTVNRLNSMLEKESSMLEKESSMLEKESSSDSKIIHTFEEIDSISEQASSLSDTEVIEKLDSVLLNESFQTDPGIVVSENTEVINRSVQMRPKVQNLPMVMMPIHQTQLIQIESDSKGSSHMHVDAHNGQAVEIVAPEEMILNTLKMIEIRNLNHANGLPTVIAISTSGKRLICNVLKENDKFVVKFNPNEIGKWQIIVEQNGKQIVNPSKQDVYITVFNPAVGNVIRSHFGPVAVGQYYGFDVDCLNVGTDSVSLDVKVVHEGEVVDCEYNNSKVGKCSIGFAPKSHGIYEVNVYCGDTHFPGSPFLVDVPCSSSITTSGDGLTTGIIDKKSQFQIDTTCKPDKAFEIVIMSPSNKSIPFTIDKVRNLISVTFVPTEIGLTTIEILYDKKKLEGSPFVANIKEPNVYVKRILKDVYIGERCSMEVDASEHTKGTIEIDSSLPVLSFEKIRERVYQINFLPKSVGLQDIILKFGNATVTGSPFQVTVKKNF